MVSPISGGGAPSGTLSAMQKFTALLSGASAETADPEGGPDKGNGKGKDNFGQGVKAAVHRLKVEGGSGGIGQELKTIRAELGHPGKGGGEAMPVEPDGGIGDGAGPIPEAR